MKCILSFLILFASLESFAGYSAEIFAPGSGHKNKLYQFRVDSLEKDGVTETSAVFTDLTGTQMIIEKNWLNGDKLIKMELDHKQIGQKATIEIKDNKVYFSKTENDKTKTSDEKLPDDFVMTGNFQKFVKSKWDSILKGDKVKFRWASWERLETVGFEVSKIAEETKGSEKVVSIKMKPSSFLIAAVVKPLTFWFSADGAKLVEMNGRVAPKQKDGNSWKDMEGDVTYKHD